MAENLIERLSVSVERITLKSFYKSLQLSLAINGESFW